MLFGVIHKQKKPTLSRLFAVALALAPLMIACGSDDDSKNKQQAAGAITSCKSLCDAQFKGDCSLLDIATCKEFCDAFVPAMTADCQAKSKAKDDCSITQGACDASKCQTEKEAFESACTTDS